MRKRKKRNRFDELSYNRYLDYETNNFDTGKNGYSKLFRFGVINMVSYCVLTLFKYLLPGGIIYVVILFVVSFVAGDAAGVVLFA